MSYKILDTNRITHTHKFFINSLEDLNSLPKEPASTALIANENKTYICTNAGNWVLFNIDSCDTTEQPEGTIEITENGTYDIAQYATAEVDVPNPSTGSLTVISNGTYNIADYASIIVNVPKSDSGNSSMYTVNSSQSLTSILNPNTLTWVQDVSAQQDISVSYPEGSLVVIKVEATNDSVEVKRTDNQQTVTTGTIIKQGSTGWVIVFIMPNSNVTVTSIAGKP